MELIFQPLHSGSNLVSWGVHLLQVGTHKFSSLIPDGLVVVILGAQALRRLLLHHVSDLPAQAMCGNGLKVTR